MAKFSNRPDLADEVDALASDLGLLPLALAQAAAYMIDRDLPCSGYRARFRDRRLSLGEVLPESGALPNDQQSTVAVTWSLSIECADLLNPVGLARPVLELMSLLDANGIPGAVLSAPAALAWLSLARGGEGLTDVDSAQDAVRCLHRLNLATHDPTSHTRGIRVHALVQRATHEQMSINRLEKAALAAADALLQAWPRVESDPDPDLSQALRASVITLTTAHHKPLWTSAGGCHPVLFRAATSLGAIGQVSAAVDCYQQLYGTAAELLGPDHPDTLTSRHGIAYWRGQAGDPAGAVTAAEALLADRMRVLGSDHPLTMNTRGGLAHLRGKAGDPATAATAFEALLADRIRVLGADHRSTLNNRGSVAHWRGKAGNPGTAAVAFEDLLADMLRVLDPHEPAVLSVRGSLAHWRGQAGDAAAAVPVFEELLADRSRMLGSEHPRTLSARGSLAHWRGQAGDPVAAVAAFEELLADMLRVLGPDHPDILNTRRELAHASGSNQ